MNHLDVTAADGKLNTMQTAEQIAHAFSDIVDSFGNTKTALIRVGTQLFCGLADCFKTLFNGTNSLIDIFYRTLAALIFIVFAVLVKLLLIANGFTTAAGTVCPRPATSVTGITIVCATVTIVIIPHLIDITTVTVTISAFAFICVTAAAGATTAAAGVTTAVSGEVTAAAGGVVFKVFFAA